MWRRSDAGLKPGSAMLRCVVLFSRDRSGATVIEYGLLATLMSVAVISCLGLFTPRLSSLFSVIGDRLAAAF